MPGQGYYKYMWWDMVRDGEAFDFTAERDKGQFIYISPQKNMVIIRNGTEFGIPGHEWLELFYAFASQW